MIFFHKILLRFAQLSFSSMTEHQDQTSTKIRRLKSALNQRVALDRVFAEARLERSDGSSAKARRLKFTSNHQRRALARVFAEARLERSDGSSSHRLSLLFSAS